MIASRTAMRRALIRSLLLTAGIGATTALLISQSAEPAAAPSTALPSVPTDDALLRAMRDELARSSQLRGMAGQEAPYFLSYTVTYGDVLHVSAAMGSALDSSRNRFRSPTIEVRVGNYDFDNTDYVGGGFGGTRYDGNWPLEDSYSNFREQFWLGTDRAFKAAVETMARKRASLNNAAAIKDPQPDFLKSPPLVKFEKERSVKIDDAAWTARATRLSSVFNTYPEILASNIELQLIQGTTSLMNSEGTAIRYPDSLYWITGKAETQAPDGMVLHDAVSIQANELENFAQETEIREALIQVAEDVKALVHAPAAEAFTGPVLFEPKAAAQFLAQLIGDNLRIPRRPLSDPGRTINFLPSEFDTRIGSRVLPEMFDVTDDPTMALWNGKHLAGNYEFDLEGVAPKPVNVIEKGVLKAILTTRQPIKNSMESNGHARLPGSWGARSAAIGNLIVKARETESMANLKKKLIDLAMQQGRPYGILIRKLDYPYSASTSELQSLAQSSAQSGGSARPISPPLMIYRVYPDGREELVRGLRFRGVSSRSLRDIQAASTETALFEWVNTAAPLAMYGSGGVLAPTSVVAPGLLFDEMEFEPPRDQLPKPATVPAPAR